MIRSALPAVAVLAFIPTAAVADDQKQSQAPIMCAPVFSEVRCLSDLLVPLKHRPQSSLHKFDNLTNTSVAFR
jgi:hypothetical protein